MNAEILILIGSLAFILLGFFLVMKNQESEIQKSFEVMAQEILALRHELGLHSRQLGSEIRKLRCYNPKNEDIV